MKFPTFLKIGGMLHSVPEKPKRTRACWVADLVSCFAMMPNIPKETRQAFEAEDFSKWSKKEIDEAYLALRDLFPPDK